MALMFPIVMLVLNVSSVAVLWFGAQRVDAGEIQIGALTAFLQYLMQILMAVMMATFMVMMVPRAAVCAERIGEVLDTDSSVVPAAAPGDRAAGAGPSSSCADVGSSTRAPTSRCCATSRFRAVPGTTTAIIGSTGAGKTTLLSLIPRLFDATAGAVLVDGVDVRELDPDDAVAPDRAGAAAAVPVLRHGRQQPALRQPGRHRRGALGGAGDRPGAGLRRGRCRTGWTRRSPRAAPTSPAASGSGSRSPGRWSAEPEIYLFDDSFSALDLATDARLRAALRPVTADAAVVIVAQRVSTIVDADQIIVLEDGGGRRDRDARRTAGHLPDVRRDRRRPS